MFGRFPRLAPCQIEGLDGLWICTDYTYDAQINISSVTLEQFFNDEVALEPVEVAYDYGNVVKPTIKG